MSLSRVNRKSAGDLELFQDNLLQGPVTVLAKVVGSGHGQVHCLVPVLGGQRQDLPGLFPEMTLP